MARVSTLTSPPQHPLQLDDRRALTLGARIGKGTRASVYRATVEGAAGVRRAVALKLFDVVASDEQDVVLPRIGRAIREAAEVRHPNVVQVYEFGLHRRKQPFALTELVEGRTLADLLDAYDAREQRLPPDIALFLGIEMAEGLAAARACGGHAGPEVPIIHGDLSARDVLLSWHGEVKVSDFGIAAAVGAASAVRTRASIGKRVITLAPEVALGESPDGRSDVFAVGALLHVMLVGPRFATDIAQEALVKQTAEGHFEPHLFGPRLPRDILSLIERATNPDPDRRLGDPAVLAFELRRAALALGVGDGRVFLRSAMQATFGDDRFTDADGPTAPTRPTTRPPAIVPGAK